MKRATLFAVITVLMWSSLAAITVRILHLPALLTVSLVLLLAAIPTLPKWREWKAPLGDWLAGVGGLFGYHYLLFEGLAHAPPVNANLVQYSWPLLIVLGTPLFVPGLQLTRIHLQSAVIGAMGMILAIGPSGSAFKWQHLFGYGLAFAAALVWAGYSLYRSTRNGSSAVVGGFCLISGVLGLLVFFSTQEATPFYSMTMEDWTMVALLGMGPMGLAFFSWDYAMRHGDPRLNGLLCYFTPVLSSLLIVVTTPVTLSLHLVLALVCVSWAGWLGGRSSQSNNVENNALSAPAKEAQTLKS